MFNIWKYLVGDKKKDKDNKPKLSILKGCTKSVDIETFKPVCSIDSKKNIRDKFKLKDYYTVIRTVYEYKDKGAYVVKPLENSEVRYFLKVKSQKNNEFKIYQKLKDIQSINLVNYISVNKIEEVTLYLFEYHNSKTLRKFLKHTKNITEKDIYQIFYEIVNGLHVLHQNGIIHCDLKPDNILICDDGVVKITDYDLSHICDDEDGFVSSHIFGTLNYVAPESYDLRIYSKKSDMWSLGVILYNMLTHRFPHNMDLSTVNSHSNLYRYNEFKHLDLAYVEKADPILKKVVKNLLNFVDTERWSTDDLLKILKI